MASMVSLVSALAALSLSAAPNPPPPHPDDASPTPLDRSSALSGVGQQLAVVVGVGTYSHGAFWPRLANAVADAAALAGELEQRYGFAVSSLIDPTLATFKATLKELASRAGPSDDIVVFFAGHGYFDPDDNAGYLVLADGTAACGSGCYAFDNLKRALYGTRARHALVMVDACHAGTFDVRAAMDSGEVRARGDGPAAPLGQIVRDYARYPSRLFMASVANTTTSDGAPGEHSPFMNAVLRELARPGPSGVVSLDRIYLALGEGAALPVGRPVPFGSVVPHHPNGTFLFIEDVPFCDTLRTLLTSAQRQFSDIRGEVTRRDPWATTSASRWMVPGAQRCDIWHWEAVGRDELRCELGPFDLRMGRDKAADLIAKVAACLPGSGTPRLLEREHGATRHLEHRLELDDGHEISVTAVCDRACDVTLVVH